MEYQYVPPVPRVHRVIISGQLQTYKDLWTEEDRDVSLVPAVKNWLDENAPRANVICDRGDWGEGTPIFYIDFGSQRQANAFMAEFGRPEAVDLELRTGRYYTTMYDGLVEEIHNNTRVLVPTAIQVIREIDDAPAITINADEEGEYVNIVFSTAEARTKFSHHAWHAYHWRQTMRDRAATEKE
jgi:hypothetical protein